MYAESEGLELEGEEKLRLGDPKAHCAERELAVGLRSRLRRDVAFGRGGMMTGF